MPRFMIKVPNDDDGEDLGEYEAYYLPRVGDPFTLWHPRVCLKKDAPFCGVVSGVTHEACYKGLPYAPDERAPNVVTTTVWLAEEHAPPTLYCDCSEKERAKFGTENGDCENCGHVRPES
jgi:hypothetical protein